MRRLACLLLICSCSGSGSETAAPADTAQVDVPAAFDEAVLDPPFSHGNAIWAGAALLDYDADGWLDIFFTNGAPNADALYRNNGDGTFTDVAEAAGLASRGNSGAVVSGDLDNDGDPDLVVSEECSTGTYSEEGEPLLDGDKVVYLNQGDGTFLAQSIGLPQSKDPDNKDPRTRCTTSMSLADIDGDGVLDLSLANAHDPDVAPPWAFDKFHVGGSDVVLYGDGQGDFPAPSEDLGHWGSFVTAHLDLDGDGRQDLLIGHSGQGIYPYMGQEDGSVELQSARSHTGRGLWMGLAVADFDGDLALEVYGTNQGLSPFMLGYDNASEAWPGSITLGPSFDSPGDEALITDWVNPFHTLLQLEDGELVPDLTWTLEAEHLLAGDLFEGMSTDHYDGWIDPTALRRFGWGWGVVALDVDADGWMDVAWTGNSCAAPMTVIWTEEQGAGPGGLLMNQGGTGFVDATWSAGVANVDDEGRYVDGRGIVTGDLNNDGYPDLVYANKTYNPSQTGALEQIPGVPRVWLSRPRDNSWLQLDLVGTLSNRDAIGATVTLTDGERTWLHVVGAGGQTNSSSSRLLTVGVGQAERVDLTVEFPSGRSTTLSDVSVNQRLTVEEK